MAAAVSSARSGGNRQGSPPPDRTEHQTRRPEQFLRLARIIYNPYCLLLQAYRSARRQYVPNAGDSEKSERMKENLRRIGTWARRQGEHFDLYLHALPQRTRLTLIFAILALLSITLLFICGSIYRIGRNDGFNARRIDTTREFPPPSQKRGRHAADLGLDGHATGGPNRIAVASARPAGCAAGRARRPSSAPRNSR